MDSCRTTGWTQLLGHSRHLNHHLHLKLPPATGCPASGQGENLKGTHVELNRMTMETFIDTIDTIEQYQQDTISTKGGLSLKNKTTRHHMHLRSAVAHLVCVMAREKRDVISSKVVADLLDLPIAFPFPPLGSTILEPNLSNTKI